jgi:hypothetical protein
MLRELALLSRAAPAPAYAATSAAVSPVHSLTDLEAALERASAGERMVVLKFYQARCRASNPSYPYPYPYPFPYPYPSP